MGGGGGMKIVKSLSLQSLPQFCLGLLGDFRASGCCPEMFQEQCKQPGENLQTFHFVGQRPTNTCSAMISR